VSAIIAFCMAVVVGVGIRLLSLTHPPLTPTSAVAFVIHFPVSDLRKSSAGKHFLLLATLG